MYIGNVREFPNVTPDKEQALKVVEEAAEVFSAWENWNSKACGDLGYYESHSYGACIEYRNLLDECADVIQATCNLLASLDIKKFEYVMDECYARNEARGRYEIQESN